MEKDRQVALSWREHNLSGVTEEDMEHKQCNLPAEVLQLIWQIEEG